MMSDPQGQLRSARDFLRTAALELRRIADLDGAHAALAASLRHIAGQCEDEADELEPTITGDGQPGRETGTGKKDRRW